jgi:hypothetical protein
MNFTSSVPLPASWIAMPGAGTAAEAEGAATTSATIALVSSLRERCRRSIYVTRWCDALVCGGPAPLPRDACARSQICYNLT